MPKQTSYTEVRNLLLVINFNQQVVPEEGGEMTYQSIRVEARANVNTADGGHKTMKKVLNIGDPVAKELTLKQIYTKVKAVNTRLANLIKDLVAEALDEDISA